MSTTATWKIRHGIYVYYSPLKNGHQMDRYFSTSNPRRFNVEIYPAIGEGDFYVESTSILRRKVSVRIWYIFQRGINLLISLSTRTVDLSLSNVRRFHVDASPTVFVDFSTLNARRFYVDISQSIRPVESSTLNIRRLHVEVSPR